MMKTILLFFAFSLACFQSIAVTPLSGTFSIPGDYPSISAAVSDLNTNGVGYGGAVFNVQAGYTENVIGITLNTNTSIDSTHFIVFKRQGIGVNPKITATGTIGTSDAAIAIIGTKYVTFDGIDIAVSGTNIEYGYYLQNSSGNTGAQNITIENCQITLASSNSNSIGIYQYASISVISASGSNSNNTFHKVNIDNAYNGIWLLGTSTSFPDFNCSIDSCHIGSTANSIGGSGTGATWGIRCDLSSGLKIFGCEVGNITMTGNKNIGGVFLSNCPGNSYVYSNLIHDIKVSGTSTSSTPTGIRIDEPAGATATTYNNMIWGFSHAIASPTATMLCRGISINQNGYTGTVNVYHNTVWISTGANPTSAAFAVGSGLVNVKNNIFYNTSTPGSTSSRYCYYAANGSISASDYNNLYIPAGTNNYIGNYAATNKATILNWRSATATDSNSLNLVVNFISGSNLHIDPANNCSFDGKGTPLASVPIDVDAGMRNLSQPDIGADEYTPVCSLPTVFTVTGGAQFCGVSTGAMIGLSGSQLGVYYQLYIDQTPTASPVAGTGSAISFGTFYGAGTYTVKSTAAACYCITSMTGQAEIVIVPIPDAPTGDTLQVIVNSGTIADLRAFGDSLTWYNSAIAGSNFNYSDSLIDNSYYYASQKSNSCESTSRLAVHVTLAHVKVINLKLLLEGLFDQTHYAMHEAFDGNVDLPKWGNGIADKIHVELFEENAPYLPLGVDISGIELNTQGWASFQISSTHSGNYYIKVSSRNHLSIWSGTAISFAANTVIYDFTSSDIQAFGSQILTQVGVNPPLYAVKLGDVDQNGWVDSQDFNVFELDLTAGTLGWSVNDFNGSGWVDSEDFNLFEPRLTEGCTSQYPGKR